jgi:alkaline phosphatase D
MQHREFSFFAEQRWGALCGRICAMVLACVFAASICAAQSAAPVIEVSNPPNSAAQQAKHYVVLVSLDGFRYDYAKKYGATNLLKIAAQGASAPDGMIPSFPSLTFPNHYSIVTGLYPEHHGIVANSFYDPARKENYAFNVLKSESDGTWYGGTPLWVLAQQQGMRAACFFWPGSDAEIQGNRPSYYLTYDDGFPDEKRVEQVLAWLQLPPEKRPHFITLYFANTDHAGHNYGPDAPQVAEAVHHVDELLGKLFAAITASGLPVDLMVVADHGMETVQGSWVSLDQWADLSHFETSGSLLYPNSDADAEKAFASLQGVSDKFKVYRRNQLPAYLNFDSNPRIGDPVVIPTGAYAITAHDPNAKGSSARMPPRGVHGYDPRQMPSMKAIFIAAGPDIRSGVSVESFENVNVYPLIVSILGLNSGPVDGTLAALQGILKNHPKAD